MGKFYRTNQNIQASKLRVIDSEGKLVGILTKQEAQDKAKEAGLDLIEIAPNADPPVARIVDFQKFRYEEGKKVKGSKKSGEGGLKELWLSPRIEEHDLKVRTDRTSEFLKKGYKVKLTVKFRGREMGHQELGYKVLQQAMDILGDSAGVEREPKMEGRRLSMIVGKSKGGNKENGQNEDEQNNTEKSQDNING